MPSDHHPEPPHFQPHGDLPPPAKGSSKMQKLLKSAFKRGGDSSGAWAGEDSELSRSPSGSSLSAASSGRPPSGRRGSGRRSEDGSVDSDRSSRESVELDGSRNSKVVAALRNAKIGYAYESFPWEKKMKELLPVPESSCFLSLLLLPMATDVSHTRYSSLEDTLARADTWLISSQASGVPIVFMNVQTEALLTKISGETAVSTVNMGSLSDIANVSLYGFEDYHGVDIGVVRAVRLWYTPAAGEVAVEMRLRRGDTRLGFAISRTEEGFIYVSSVADETTPGVASTRSGLLDLHRAARRASRLLVLSRVGGDKVLPWMASTAGDVKCFDTVSLSQKLSLHRHALRPITLHFLMWDHHLVQLHAAAAAETTPPPPPPDAAEGDGGDHLDGDVDDGPLVAAGRGSKDSSFRFQNIGLPDSWL